MVSRNQFFHAETGIYRRVGADRFRTFPFTFGERRCRSIFFTQLRMTWAEHNWRETAKLSIFPVVLISNAAGIIALAMKLPVYSTMKASYFLVSLPAFAYFLSSGVMAMEKHKILRWLIVVMFSSIMLVVLFHIFHIVSYLYLIPQY